jgi:heme/copper-type cytochrome/quinol oxidase subunit 3
MFPCRRWRGWRRSLAGIEFPNYGARLRRARLGLICGIATVSMVFISLTSAYVVRQGLPTFDGATNSYVRDWGQVQLPWLLLAINTALLLISSVTMEFARREIGAAGGAGSGAIDSGDFAGR